jgi:pimeloyl-ACP methyl ester carboxylesterase
VIPDAEAEMDFLARPQQRVEIGAGRRLNIWRCGEGGPAVVLCPGFMAVTADWRRVQPVLGETTTVVSWDHAGQGFSDPGPMPQTAAGNAADIRAALAAAGIAPPYVLVGLSMGGFEARHFARQNPGEVVGMVLVDPSIDDSLARITKVTPSDQTWGEVHHAYFKSCEAAALAGELRPGTEAYAACVLPSPSLTDSINAGRREVLLQPSYWGSLASEFHSFIRDRADWPLGDMPLIVLSAGARELRLPVPDAENEAVNRVWTEAHAEMARLSSRGVMRVVADSLHHMPMDKPQAVIDAVLEVVEQARSAEAVGA